MYQRPAKTPANLVLRSVSTALTKTLKELLKTSYNLHSRQRMSRIWECQLRVRRWEVLRLWGKEGRS